MNNPELQLMIHGNKIAEYNAEIKADGVEVVSQENAENPNYLFLNLLIDESVLPGTFNITFTKEKEKLKYKYVLNKREANSETREGFNSSDVIYLIMPDRFANGNPDNDIIPGMLESTINREDPYGRHGGDIQGIINHLDYVENMGFTSLWINPLLENNQKRQSYHGYAITDFYKTDPRYGNNEEYLKLSQTAADKDIKMIMDMIFNHCGSEHWWMKDMPMVDWINYNENYRVTNHRRTVIQDPHASEGDYELMRDGWFVPTMPDLNLRNPFLAEYMIQNSIWWIEYLGLSGIRMDTYPYPDKFAMAEWNRRITAEYPNFNIVGEEWSMNAGIVSYWQKGQLNRDGYEPELPSLMDFPLQNAISQSLLSEEETHTTGLAVLYEALANDFLYPDPDNLVIFLDNHDMSRFYMQMEMDINRFRNGVIYLLTTRGIPQIYYGTEFLMDHIEGNDHGNIRKDVPGGWPSDSKNIFEGVGLDTTESENLEFFRNLLNYRKNTPALQSGELVHYAPENSVYVYFRTDKQDSIMVILNKNKTPFALNLERFKEFLKDKSYAIDIIGGEKIVLINKMMLAPGRSYILELK